MGLLLNRRREMGGSGVHYDAWIEYIQNPSQAYIDTGFYYQTGHNVSYILDYTVVGSVSGQSYFGSRNSASSSGNGWSGIPYVGNVYVGTTSFGTFNAATNTRYTLDVSISNSGATCSFIQKSGGSTVASNSASITTLATMNNSIVLFADQYNSGVSQYCTGIRVHSFKIIDNGTTVRDYIPVRVGQVGYLYDKVSKKLFGNAGSGSFTIGSDVKEIAYIQSSGTQWINTQYIPTTNTKAEMSCNITPYTQYDTPFGSRTGANSGSFLIFARYGSNNNAYYDFGNGEAAIGADASNYGNDITISLSNTQAIFGNKSVSYSKTLSSSYPIYLFNLNQSNAVYSGNICACVMKLYSFKLYESNTLVRDFIPVKIGTTGYLYDKITGNFYGNSGSGSFTLGPDV